MMRALLAGAYVYRVVRGDTPAQAMERVARTESRLRELRASAEDFVLSLAAPCAGTPDCNCFQCKVNR